MLASLNSAVSGLQQFQQQINVIGNNIANVDTVGYKGSRALFEDTFSQALTDNAQVGTGVGIGAIRNEFGQGGVTTTGVDTHLMIKGEGFFLVKDTINQTPFVTRAGDFKLDGNGYLVTNSGLRVQGYSDSGLATIDDLKIDAAGAPATALPGAAVDRFSIDQTGTINVMLSDGTEFVRGRVLLQNFSDTSMLTKEGANLYSYNAAAGVLPQPVSPQTSGVGSIQSGALEMANVELTSEMSGLITAQRAFQANARVFTTSDEMLQELVNLKR